MRPDPSLVSLATVLTVTPLGRPARGRVRPPGSKSITNRALIVAALPPPGASRLWGALEADDTAAMRSVLRRLGVLIDDNDDPWLVLGTGGDLSQPAGVLDVGASGTTARFVSALAALAPGPVTIDGSPRMRDRPMAPLFTALSGLGVVVRSTSGRLPVSIEGGRLGGGTVQVESRLSSQFASAVLMVAPMAAEEVEIVLVGEVASSPYLDTTVEVMRAFGASVERTGGGFLVRPGGYATAEMEIEADASAAVYPAVAAAITAGQVLVEGIPATSTQPDLAVLGVLEEMGCEVDRRDDGVVVTGPDKLSAVDADMSGAPDGALAVAVAALFADGRSRLHGLSTLRLKETDRMSALMAELGKVGAEVSIEEDTLQILPGRLRGAEIETYDDHRMAMALALVGLVVPGVVIRDPMTVSKTWPGYFDMLGDL